MMTPDDAVAEARARLQAERVEVMDELETLRARLETKGDYGLGEGDPMIYQWELNLALCKRAEQHLAEIDEALEQLEMGIYGRCERCGKANRSRAPGSLAPYQGMQPVRATRR